MSRKPKKGYFVRGQFVAEGSELDLQLKAEQKHFQDNSKTELKRESTELQKLGEQLMSLREGLFERLQLPEKLVEALAEAGRITNFEGKRRQMQYVGKLMRGLDEEQLAAVREALDEQRQGSARDSLALHEAERWRDDLIAREEAFGEWIAAHPDTDSQQLRALVRQARKDRQPTQDEITQGLVPRHGRAYREIFQLVKEQLHHEHE
ncbi:ribosome biogenesis factor YjgA [Ramlibacter sp. MMS24-I3-19]|uniref:ribosome biogenesis factor YjgA n=1 Tax=Ramlibacter sp. MMS24-I3-19 TaxID=3416606 RepID=UPI003CFEEC68